jgi:hypothetical protein
MPLSLQTQPGFTEVPDSAFDAGNPVTSANLKALNAGAKFAAVRNEQFVAEYKHGETVTLPVSPVDGYQYTREELRYSWSVKYTASASRDASGKLQGGPTGGPGHLLFMSFDVNQQTGLVSCVVAYHKDGGAQTNTNDGILTVITHAQRNR